MTPSFRIFVQVWGKGGEDAKNNVVLINLFILGEPGACSPRKFLQFLVACESDIYWLIYGAYLPFKLLVTCTCIV